MPSPLLVSAPEPLMVPLKVVSPVLEMLAVPVLFHAVLVPAPNVFVLLPARLMPPAAPEIVTLPLKLFVPELETLSPVPVEVLAIVPLKMAAPEPLTTTEAVPVVRLFATVAVPPVMFTVKVELPPLNVAPVNSMSPPLPMSESPKLFEVMTPARVSFPASLMKLVAVVSVAAGRVAVLLPATLRRTPPPL